MKTILFLALLSLSFAFVPESLYNNDNNLKTVTDAMIGSSLESLPDAKSSDSSDYLVVEMCSDESDWNDFASEMIELFKPIWTNFTESYLGYLSNKTDVNLENDLFFSIVRLVDETIMGYSGNATEDVYLERDILLSVAQFINETREEKGLSYNIFEGNNSKVQTQNDTDETDWSNLEPLFVNFTENYSNNSNVTLERDILLSVAQFVNETRMEKDLSDEDDYLVIDIELYSNSSDSESEIIEIFKPIFMNFTEAYYEYLSNNNVSLEDQTLNDDILTSIAQLFNGTIEEMALYGDTNETNKTIETDKSEVQNGFLGL